MRRIFSKVHDTVGMLFGMHFLPNSQPIIRPPLFRPALSSCRQLKLPLTQYAARCRFVCTNVVPAFIYTRVCESRLSSPSHQVSRSNSPKLTFSHIFLLSPFHTLSSMSEPSNGTNQRVGSGRVRRPTEKVLQLGEFPFIFNAGYSCSVRLII